MAGDWIKMRTSLLTNPKVNGIARILERASDVGRVLSTGYNGPLSEIVTRTVTRHVTVSCLLIVWGAANEHTKDGVFTDADLSDIDDMVGIPGFGAAMVEVGWAEFDSEKVTVSLPNFSEYNTSGHERTAGAKTNAERQKEYRDRKNNETVTGFRNESDVTESVTSNRREEKRREEVKSKALVPSLPAEDPPAVPIKVEKPPKPDCPHEDIIALYHECLPQCQQVRDWTPARQANLRARWNEDDRRQNLEYWRLLFEYVGACDFLMGRSGKSTFMVDLEWITKQNNFVKIREGKYENRA